ncbi:enoyl-CoA hydratase [Rhodococcus aetherivorans]|nr:enoyl-CoA hydratase [Rhodococcus aetherivorans]
MDTPEDAASVRLQVTGPVATVTMDHLARRNALTTAMLHHLEDILTTVQSDRSIRIVVLTGAGGDFSAGMDIRSLRSARERGVELEHRMTDAEERLAAFPKPTVAAVEGYCVGGGMQLALACDLRLASECARFGVTPAKLGIAYPPRTVARLVRTLGPAAAKRLVFTAELIDADTALRMGLVDEVTPSGGVAARATELAHLVSTRSAISLAAAKEMIDAAGGHDIDQAVTRRWSQEANPDAAEGIDAFLAGRAPRFSGDGPAGTQPAGSALPPRLR